MKLWRTLIFSLLFTGVAIVLIYQGRLEKQILSRSPDEVNRVFTFEKSDSPNHMEIFNRATKIKIIFDKKGEQWMLTSPVNYPAEASMVEGLVIGLRLASNLTRLRADKEWEEYGLAEPEIEVTLGFPKKKAQTLLLGEQAPIGNAVYAKWGSERGYFLLRGELKSAFQLSVYGLREKRIFRTLPEQMEKIYVEMGIHSYQWKKEKGEWYWMEPVSQFGKKISSEDMNKILAALQGLFIKEFLDDNKKSKADLGFFMIHDRIQIDHSAGKPEIFHFGNEVPLQSAYYGFREGEETVFLVDRGKVIRMLDLLKAIGNQTEKSQEPNSKFQTITKNQ